MPFIDCHVHTKHSHDSMAEPPLIIAAAMNKGLTGLMFSDHVDIGVEGDAFLQPAYGCYGSFCEEKQRLEDEGSGFMLAIGAEIGESIRNQAVCARLIGDIPFDAVLGSVHKVYLDGKDFCFSNYRFSELPADLVRRVVVQYYCDVLRTAEESDIDILCHLTHINKYEMAPQKEDINDPELGEIIRETLRTIIRRGIALEINMSWFEKGMFAPDANVLRVYRSMGGELVTFGSDAHVPENVGKGFREAAEILKNVGIKHACYFKKRQPVRYVPG